MIVAVKHDVSARLRFIPHPRCTVYDRLVYQMYENVVYKDLTSDNAAATEIKATPVDTATAAVTSGKAVS